MIRTRDGVQIRELDYFLETGETLTDEEISMEQKRKAVRDAYAYDLEPRPDNIIPLDAFYAMGGELEVVDG